MVMISDTGESTGEAHGLDVAVAFQRDLYLYWHAASTLGSLPLSKRDLVSRPVVRRLRAAMGAGSIDTAEGDDPRRLFLRRLLERLSLLRRETLETPTLVPANRAVMERYLTHPLTERIRICARLWVAGNWWTGASSATTPARLLAPAPPRVALARRRLLEALAALDPVEPVDAAEIPVASIASGRATRQGRPHVTPRGTADEAEIHAALRGPLRWMGLVVPTAGEDGPLLAGAALRALRRGTDGGELPPVRGRVVVQPNMEVIAYPPLTAPTLFALDTCAARETLDVAARYRLTWQALTQAARAGWEASEVSRRLERLTGAPLPPNVAVTLADWGRSAARVRLHPAVTLLEVRAPAVLEALLADRAARGWVERRLTPTVALLHPETLDRLRAWLLRHGEVPAHLTGAPPATDSAGS